jgi:prevent-host-death family protein
MAMVSVHEAKTHLSRLLRRVESGEEIIIARAGRPIAKLVPTSAPRRRELGFDRGKVIIADDFDAPLDAETFEPVES